MVSLLVPPNVAATIDQHISNSDPISFWRERDREIRKGTMIDHEQLSPLVRWRSLTLLSPHREWKAKVFSSYTKDGFYVFFQVFFFLSPSMMQVIPNSEASIVQLLFKKKNHSLELVKIEECPEKINSQSIARGKERLLVIGLAKRPCI